FLVWKRQFQKIFQGTKKYIQNPLYNWTEMVYTEIIRDNGPDLRAQQNKKHSGVIEHDRFEHQQRKTGPQCTSCPGKPHHSADLCPDAGSAKGAGKGQKSPEECRTLGCESPEPVPDHLA